MNRRIIMMGLSLLIFSCSPSKYFISKSSEYRVLTSALNELDKKDNPELRQKIETTYSSLSENLLTNVATAETMDDPSKWGQIVDAYAMLDKLSGVIRSSKAGSFVDAPSYASQLNDAKQKAAEEYYGIGMESIKGGDKHAFREAYHYLSKVNNYAPGYKDVKNQLEIARRGSVLDVIINPVTDHSIFYSQMIPNRFGNSFNNDRMQRTLVNDLGGNFAKDANAHFYTDRDAHAKGIIPDWFIDLTWTRFDIPQPLTQTFTVERSKEIEKPKNAKSNTPNEVVYATVYVSRRYFTAYGDLEYVVSDAASRDIIDRRTLTSQIDWNQSYATYKGDSRALTYADKAMISNRTRLPTRDQILQEIYNKMYPQLRSDLQNLVR